jgi:hypothetical protein
MDLPVSEVARSGSCQKSARCRRVALTATLFLIVSAIVLGTAITRTDRRLRWHGIAYAVLLPAFAIPGFALQAAQPWTGFLLAAATAALAVRLQRLSR